jgi:hypothetical protein
LISFFEFSRYINNSHSFSLIALSIDPSSFLSATANSIQVCGTPTEEMWPGVSSFPDYKSTFPKWQPQPMRNAVRNLDEHGIDLISVCCLISLFDRRFLFGNSLFRWH